MSKKVKATNSPFPWDYFPADVVAYWAKLNKIRLLPTGEFRFLEKFELAIQRSIRDQELYRLAVDDGSARRWATREMSRQLRLLSEVGTMPGVTRNPDKLRRRTRRDKGRSLIRTA